jgi:putative PIN family toxin of toxin-antitoxin system
MVVSAFLFDRSMPARALKAARYSGRLLLSVETARELSEVLEREKFDRYVRRETRREFLVALLEEAKLVAVNEQFEVCRDPDDDKFLELAVAGEATAIVGGDDDLLVLPVFRDIPILKAKALLQEVKQDEVYPSLQRMRDECPFSERQRLPRQFVS